MKIIEPVKFIFEDIKLSVRKITLVIVSTIAIFKNIHNTRLNTLFLVLNLSQLK